MSAATTNWTTNELIAKFVIYFHIYIKKTKTEPDDDDDDNCTV